jgi:hypothetical protein
MPHPLPAATTAVLLALLAAAPARGQELALTLAGPHPGSDFGAAVGAVGDLTGDGVPEILVGAWRAGIGGPLAGAVYLHSGADGVVLREHHGLPGHRLGLQVLGLDDVDGDGSPDYALSAQRNNNTGLLSGYAEIRSGATGALLHHFETASNWDRNGATLAAPGDIDGDGVADLLVGAPQDDWQGPGAGAVRIYSGATGALLQIQFGRDPWDLFGTSACGVGDLDGDGRGDFAVGSPRADTPAAEAGSVQVFSGRTGAELRRIEGHPGDVLGVSVALAGDFDGDGRADLAVGAVDDFSSLTQRPGLVRVHSLLDGSTLAEFAEQRNTEGFGLSLAGLADANGDGYGDLLVGAPFAGLVGAGGLASGAARLYSGLSGRLAAEYRGESTQDRRGAALAAAGDVNGDGLDDFLVGEPGGNPNGQVTLFRSVDLPVISVSNLVAGQTAEVRTDGGDPGDYVLFFYGLSGFGSTVYGSGISLDLASPAFQLGNATCDALGATTLPVPIPSGTRGARVWLQAWHVGAVPPGHPSSATTVVVG